jgi:hypothetical protein
MCLPYSLSSHNEVKAEASTKGRPGHRNFFNYRSFNEGSSEGAACPREAQRSPRYPFQVLARSCSWSLSRA